MNHYVAAGKIFLKEKNTFLAYNLILDALAREEYNPEVWFLTGYSLGAHYATCRDQFFMVNSWASYKRSLQLDPQHLLSKQILKSFDDTVSGHELLKRIPIAQFDFVMELKADVTAEHVLEGYRQLKDEDDKIALPMHLGETKNPVFFNLLKHCILEETNRHVIYAALKRIHYYKDTHDLEPIFKEIVHRGVKDYEPYFSMAIKNIDTEWARELSKYSVANFIFTEDKATEIDTETQAMVKAIYLLSFSVYKLQEINDLYNQRNNKVLAYYLTHNLNNEGLSIIKKNNIIDNTGQFTERGWEYLKEYIEAAKGGDHNAGDNKERHSNKSWWKFW